MPRLLRYVSLLLILSCASGAVASNINIAPSQRHDTWDAAAGFPGGYVYAIAQTADGYIWIGTSKGLVRYDGLTFVPAREKGSSEDPRIPVLGVLVDSNDQLWATDDHTHVFRYAAGQLIGPVPDNGRHQYLTAVLGKTQDGSLLFASELQGLVEYVRGSASVLLDPSMMPRLPTAVAQTEDGAFWIGTEAGVFRLSVKHGSPEIRQFAALANTKVNCLLAAADSVLYIGTDKGLLKVHSGKLATATAELAGVEILALANGREGDVWIGSHRQVLRAHAKDIDRDGNIRALESLTVRGTVTSLFEDRDRDLWIGGPEMIERYRASAFTTYLTSAGLPCSNCGAIYIDRHNRIWFAPWDGGLFLLSQGLIRAIEIARVKDDAVYSIEGGMKDEVWVARRNGGITRFDFRCDTLQATTYTRQNGLAQNSVYSIYLAPDRTVWAGSLSAGLSRFRNGKWHTYAVQDGLPSNTISAITGNSTGEIFVGTPNGLGVLKNEHWVSYNAQQGLPPGAIESLLLDGDGTLWIGTTKGISFLRSGTLHVPLGAPDALYGEILGIAENEGWLWMTTRDHVLRVRRAALLNQTFGESDYRQFGTIDGLPSTEGVRRSRSVVADNRGHIWFSLNKGISDLQPSAFASQAFPVTTRLDDMLVDGRAVPSERLEHIPAGRHRLTFRYVGVNVSNPDGVQYRYRLDGADPGWSDATSLREIDYTNVPPGKFQFRVIARNPDGVWSDQETRMAFEIDPAYWQTRWFQLGGVLALLLLIFGVYQIRVGELRRQFNAALDARVDERTRIARELHDTLLQSFQGLLLRFQTASNLLPSSAQEAKQKLDGAIDLAAQAITEGRDAVQGLRSTTEITNDLAVAVSALGKDLAANQTSQNSPVVRVDVEGEPRDLHPILRDEVYRIASEALRNAFHHAQADRVEVEIRYDAHHLRVRVRDDGKGIDAQVIGNDGRSGHWGLHGMRERAKIIGGNLEVWSSPQSGTEVELTIPARMAYATASQPHSWLSRKEAPRTHD
jgi:signal transduction histidine kinase/ligand-binding sensor domain-containing protein